MKATKLNREIVTIYNSEIVVKRSSRLLIQSLAGIILGVVMIVGAFLFIGDHASVLYMSLLTLGAIIAIVFVIKLSSRNTEYFYNDTNAPIEGFSLYYDPLDLDTILKYIERGESAPVKRLADEEESSLRLDCVISKDNKFGACQPYHFVPYNYEPVSKVHRIDGGVLRSSIN